MPRLKLTYFDIDGGRAEAIRLALTIGKMHFEDHRISISEWNDYRKKMPLWQVPVMEIDGEAVTQTNSLLRFAGKAAGLYPDDALAALHCDEVMATVEDILSRVVATLFIQDEEEKRQKREALAAGPLTLYLDRLEAVLKARGGLYFAGDRFSVADLKVFVWIRSLRNGTLDYVPVDLVDRVAPILVDHFDRIAAHPDIVAYYEQRANAG